MPVRTIIGACAAFLVVCSLTACSPGDSGDGCAVNGKWEAFPSNFRADSIAKVLGVSENDVRSGGFGSVHCGSELSVDAIASDAPPIVMVSGKGHHCMALGTQSQPKPGTMTRDILAVCPGTEGAA